MADSPAWDVLSQFVPGLGGAVVGGVRGSNKDKTGIGMLRGAGGQVGGMVGGGLGGVGLMPAVARKNPLLALMLPYLGALSGGAVGQNLATRRYNKPEPSLLDKIKKVTRDTGENISDYWEQSTKNL